MSEATEKRCPTCGITKPSSDFFRRTRSKDGLDWHCKQCERDYQRTHRRTPEFKAKARQHRTEHRDEINERKRRTYRAKWDQYRGAAKRRYEANREHAIAQNRRYYRQRQKLKRLIRAGEQWCTRTLKRCARCGEFKPKAEYRAHRRYNDGLDTYCLPCVREMDRQRYYANHEENKAARRSYYRNPRNRERLRQHRRKQYYKNPERSRQKTREWYYNNLEKARAALAEYRKQTPKEVKRRWQKKYNESPRGRAKRVEHASRRYARKKETPINDLTADQILWIKEQYGHRCAYCGQHTDRLTIDHVIPLSRKGPHTLSNIVPACQSCNSRKGAKTPEEAGMQVVIEVNLLAAMEQSRLF